MIYFSPAPARISLRNSAVSSVEASSVMVTLNSLKRWNQKSQSSFLGYSVELCVAKMPLNSFMLVHYRALALVVLAVMGR
jgi:hypothetical protein